MLKITMDNARNWIVAAAVGLFIGAGIAALVFTPFTLVDAVIYTALGVFVLRESRTAATIAFCYYALGRIVTIDVVLGNTIVFVLSMAMTLCLLQGMRATYFIYKYKNFVAGSRYEPGEIVDADFELIGSEVPQSKDQK